MPCYHPWTPPASMGLIPGIQLPCRQCIGCKLNYSTEWAARCIHETKSHFYNCWITLTYDDEHLPYGGTLYRPHVTTFLRTTRKASTRIKNAGSILADRVGRLRYFYSGEYGEKKRRPHYHLCLFGLQMSDLEYEKQTELGHKLYTSKLARQLWPHGDHIIGELTYETAAYTARYITKKITGQLAEKHYETIDKTTGEIIQLQPEFSGMSTNPGIGHDWYEKYHKDVHRTETKHIYINGKKTKTPRYYDKLHKRNNPIHNKKLHKITMEKARKNKKNTTQPRLTAQETITIAATKNLKQKI